MDKPDFADGRSSMAHPVEYDMGFQRGYSQGTMEMIEKFMKMGWKPPMPTILVDASKVPGLIPPAPQAPEETSAAPACRRCGKPAKIWKGWHLCDECGHRYHPAGFEDEAKPQAPAPASPAGRERLIGLLLRFSGIPNAGPQDPYYRDAAKFVDRFLAEPEAGASANTQTNQGEKA